MVCRHMESDCTLWTLDIYAVSPKCAYRSRSLLDSVLFHRLVDPAPCLGRSSSRVYRVIEPLPHESSQTLSQPPLGGKDHHQHQHKHLCCKNEARTDRLKLVLVVVLRDSRACLVVPWNRVREDDDLGGALAPRAASMTTQFEHGLEDGSDD